MLALQLDQPCNLEDQLFHLRALCIHVDNAVFDNVKLQPESVPV